MLAASIPARGALIFLLASCCCLAQPGAREERDARRALDRIERAVRGGRWERAWPLLARFEEGWAETEAANEEASWITAVRRHARVELFGGLGTLSAHLEPAGRGRTRLRFDFAQKGVWRDFQTFAHLPDDRELVRIGRRLQGTGALILQVPFKGPIDVTLTAEAHRSRDLGLLLFDPRERTRFLVAAANNTYFATKYDKDRKSVLGHVLVYCGRGAESLSERYPSQLLGSTTGTGTPKEMEVRLSIERSRLVLVANGRTVSAALTSAEQRFPRAEIGVHLRRSDLTLRSLTIVGSPDPEWAKGREQKLRARLEPLPSRRH